MEKKVYTKHEKIIIGGKVKIKKCRKNRKLLESDKRKEWREDI